MKILRFSSQYKKDAKRYRNQPKKMEQVAEILRMLRDDVPIPQRYEPHMLKGDFSGCMECHIAGDFLLIWIDETANQIGVLRLGTHSELFG
ncbi:MAG: type II toxin-antitoxin system YafQ family toxin [Bacteroides sp.]|nr:type II toxin-antitoxin system YafQ family toxin [Ruminococcus flavefaciens]MCM1554495.1 type II toxin-antitoxin system YafQ family toxin [Bacteroides sp.]